MPQSVRRRAFVEHVNLPDGALERAFRPLCGWTSCVMWRHPVSELPIPLRKGGIKIADLVDLYVSHYAGCDTTRPQRLTW